MCADKTVPLGESLAALLRSYARCMFVGVYDLTLILKKC